jgi:hypothetical protein
MSGVTLPRCGLSARLFYSIILSGLMFGSVVFAAAGWLYLHTGDQKTNR